MLRKRELPSLDVRATGDAENASNIHQGEEGSEGGASTERRGSRPISNSTRLISLGSFQKRNVKKGTRRGGLQEELVGIEGSTS